MEIALKHALNKVHREDFIPSHLKQYASLDQPLPIGDEQTISQPSLVAYMTHKLRVNKKHRVLEIGTGSGYQTALLAEMAKDVFTIERIADLSLRAQATLVGLGYRNIQYKIGSGYDGWVEKAPFDRIMITAAADKIPMDVFKQLKPDGRMILPLQEGPVQVLYLVTKFDGLPDITSLVPVTFVPMIH